MRYLVVRPDGIVPWYPTIVIDPWNMQEIGKNFLSIFPEGALAKMILRPGDNKIRPPVLHKQEMIARAVRQPGCQVFLHTIDSSRVRRP